MLRARNGILVLLACLALACDSVEKACADCCNVPLVGGLCREACVKAAHKMNLEPDEVRRVCPGR